MENNNRVTDPTECNPATTDCRSIYHPKKQIVLCKTGGGDCIVPEFLIAGVSAFHTEKLRKATNEINKILADIPENQNGSLSILKLPQGLILAWVEHGGAEEIEGGITTDSDPDLIAKHYNLI